MEYIVEFFEWFGDLFSSLWDFLSSTIDNIILFIQYLGYGVSMAYDIISTLPYWLQGFATITILVSVVYIIIGRSTGGNKSD